MYRGRPPPRGSYPPSFEGRGPRPYPGPDYRDDRSRPKPPYQHGFHEHGTPESYRRSPPRRRYPSPGSGSHRGAEYWSGAPPRERSPSPRKSMPLDHNLVITVGNELTGSAPSHPHDRGFPARLEQSWSRGHSPDRNQAKSRGRSRSRDRSRSPDQSRVKSRGRSKSRDRSPDRSRAKSRGHSKSRSRSPDRSRAKSRGRSKSRAKSQLRSQSRSPDRIRAKSRGRSKSRPRNQSRSPDRGWAKSRGRSKSRHGSRSRSRSWSRSRSKSRSRSRSRGRSRGRSFSKAAGRVRSKSRQRSRSSSSSSSSSSRSRDEHYKDEKMDFKELEMARRRKEMEDLMSQPTKSILKKRNDSEDSPSVRSIDSPRVLDGPNMTQIADQLLHAMKSMEPHMVASVLSELRSDPQMAQRLGLDTEIKEILNLLGGAGTGTKAETKMADDIDDEEKFLYGESEEPKPPPVSESFRHHGLDQFGDITEEALYGDCLPSQSIMGQTYGHPSMTTPHHQGLPTKVEPDKRYVSQPTIGPDQNITVQVSNPACSADTAAIEEYEKIQDLLKTIGLDLGVTEISNMAARTKERLHGNKPPPKTPTRRRRYSSGSSDGGRRRRSRSSSSSSSRSCSRGRKRGGSWSSDDVGRKSTSQKSHKDVSEMKNEQVTAVVPPLHPETPPITPNPTGLPPHPAVPISPYPPPQPHNMMPPSYPPQAYGQYTNYLTYMHQQQWPPMYPPPNMSLPPPTSHDDFTATQQYQDPYHQLGPEQGVKVSVKMDDLKGGAKHSILDRKVSEKENNESQKQKVLEEREKLKKEREVRMKKKEYLMKELEQLRKQQGELLRKKRREKEGHKDPLLLEISRLQEDVMTQIANLRKEHEAAEKKRTEIDKVALILGIGPGDRPRKPTNPPADREGESVPPEKKKRDSEPSPEGQPVSSTAPLKTLVSPSQRASPDKMPAIRERPVTPPLEPFEYYDAGNHWCKNCNITCGSMFDFFTHLHSKTHRKTLDPYDRPWATTPTKITKNVPPEEKLTKPAKGSEFLLPVRGFFCLLCKEFYGDAICAEEHVTTHTHNEKYKKQMYENPLYEQRRNLDRQAGLTSDISGKKRKHENDEKGGKDKEEKTKHKKEKKDKEKKKEDDGDTSHKEEKCKVKEEDEDKLKSSRTVEDFKNAKSLEEQRPLPSKKDDKYRHSKEDEERTDRYKYSREEDVRHRYRRDEDDRSKYGPKDEDRYKYGKHYDSKSKYDRERDEGKPFKHPEREKPAGKPEVSKPEPPSKPYEPPKILCGPSPAMRAKLRKQSQEAGKTVPVSTPSTFGKFTWKKKDNTLAKVAEKIAAEFTKEDEAEASKQPVSVEDSFAKTMAVAKEIAEKLGNQPVPPPSFVSNGANRGWVRPNLQASFFQKTNKMGTPAPMNTFLSIRPGGVIGPLSKDSSDPLTKAMIAQSQLLGATAAFPVGKPAPLEVTPTPAVSTPKPSEAKPPLPVTRPGPSGPVPAVSTPKPSEAKPPLPVSRPGPLGPVPAVSTPKPSEANPPLPVSRPGLIGPVPAVSTPKSSEGKPQLPVTRPGLIGPVPAVSTPKPSEANPPLPVTRPGLIGPVPAVSTSKSSEGKPQLPVTRPGLIGPVPAVSTPKSSEVKPQLPVTRPGPIGPVPAVSTPKSSEVKPQLPVTRPGPIGPVPVVSTPKPSEAKPPSSVSRPTPTEIQSAPPVSKPVTTEANSGPGFKPPPSVAASVSSASKATQPAMVKIVSDVAAPGVPESEQSLTVFVKPPPFTNVSDRVQKSDKVKTNLGVAKAQELLGIFYSSVGQSGPSITRPDSKAEKSSSSSLPAPEAPKLQLQPLAQTQRQPSPVVHTSSQSDTTTSPTPLDQPQSEIQISSVWSLTCSATPEVAPSETSQSTQQTLTPSAQFEVHNEPRVCSSASASESQTTLQPEPARPQPASQPQVEPTAHSESHVDALCHPETYTESTPQPKPKPSPKSRGKKASPATACPVRQTRYQTRRQQQQKQPESEPEAASESADSDSRGLEILDPGSGSQSEEGAPSESVSQVMEITPETLGLPSDMTSLDFDYDFNFE